MPPDADTTPETFVAADLDSLVNAVRQAGDGDTIDIRNVSINPEWNQLPLRIRNDVKVTGNIEVSMLASTRSIEEAEASSRALDGKAYLFRVDGNADVVFDSFTVVIEEAAKDFINAVISIDRGSASFSGISITPDVVAVELGTHAAADSVTGTLAGARIEVVPDNPSSFEIAQEIADKTGATPSVNGQSFAVIDTVQNKGYATLKGAFEGALDGSVIKLGKDIVTNELFQLTNKNLTLDLNGKTISGSATLVATKGIILVGNDSDIVIDDTSAAKTGKIDGTAKKPQGENNYYAIYCAVSIWPDSGHKASLTVKNGTLIGMYYAIAGQGTVVEEDSTDILIEGGTLISNDGAAIYHPQNGTLTVNGGELTGKDTAIEIRAGKLTITGGEFTALTTPTDVTGNGSGTTTAGSAIGIAQHTTMLPLSVDISGGTFNGFTAVYESNPQDNPEEASDTVSISISGGVFNAAQGGTQVIYSEDCDKFISGGTFSIKPEDKYIAEGFASEKTDAGWSVEAYSGRSIYSEDDFERRAVISIGGEAGYDDESAIILDGNVKLMSDITTEHIIYVPKGTDAILDLNGHVIESRFKGYSIGNFGNLTINDSSDSEEEKGTGIVYNSSKILPENGFAHDAIRNYGELVINSGTFGDSDIDIKNANDTTYGTALRNIGNATINGGYFTCVDNYGTWEGGADVFSYAIRSEGSLEINGGHVYGSMNGGISADAGEITINDCEVDVYGRTAWHTLTLDSGTNSAFFIYGGVFRNTETDNGHVFSAFKGMPSWQIGASRTELESAGYYVYGGTFIEDRQEITITE